VRRMSSRSRPFVQVDVFTAVPYLGNPLAVVIDGADLSDAEMQHLAHWTNLSETTFLVPPTDPAADYRVRIFTTTRELPFAGHPTIGSCHAWLGAGGVPKQPGVVVQECGVGLLPVRLGDAGRAAFGAPPLRHDEPAPGAVAAVAGALGIPLESVQRAAQLTNGPSFLALHLDSAQRVLDIDADFAALGATGMEAGLVGPHPAGSDCDVEVRLLMSGLGTGEDPVTGSLNAALAQWLIGEGLLPERYVAAQGTRLGRAGRVYLERDLDGQVWVGGDAVTCISGTIMA